jgi:hypothetical protein
MPGYLPPPAPAGSPHNLPGQLHPPRSGGRGRKQTGGLQADEGAAFKHRSFRLSQNRNESDLPFQKGHGYCASKPGILVSERSFVIVRFGERWVHSWPLPDKGKTLLINDKSLVV